MMNTFRIRGLAAALLAIAVGAPAALAQDSRVSVVPVRPLESGSARANGRVLPKWIARVGSRVKGLILTWGTRPDGTFVDVGSHVAKGDELFRIDTATFARKVAAATATTVHARAMLADLQAGTRPERIAAAEAALAEIEARLDEWRRDEVRYRRLVEEDKTVPPKKLEEVQMQLGAAEAQRRAAQARLAEAKAGSTPTEIAIAEARVAEAESMLRIAELDLADCSVKAAFDGIVTRRFKSPGDYVNDAPFVEVLELVSDHDLEAEMKLPEALFSGVSEGRTPVALSSPLLDGELTLPVTRVVGAIDPADGVFAFRVAIPADRQQRLVPGAFLQGIVTFSRGETAVIVPAAALVTESGRTFVYVARDGVMRKTAVMTGDRLSDSVVVLSGLSAADRVVIGPPADLRDGAPLPPAARSN